MYLNDYLDDIIRNGLKKPVELGELKTEYEPTRRIYENRSRLVFFTVEGSPYTCYSNILVERKDLYHLLGVNSDVEAYEKILWAVENPAGIERVDFNEYYKPVDNTLYDIPFIKYYREDRGYYLTSSIIVSCIGEVCNASFHRMMRLNESEAAVRIVPRHLKKIVESYHNEGLDAPAVVLLGLHPLYEIAAATSPPYGVYEFSIASRLLGDNLYAYTPIHGIPIPPYAGIVLEGVITREKAREGPFVDILRIPDRVREEPVFRVERIYVNRYRNPLIHAIVAGLDEHLLLMGFPREPLIYDSIRRVTPGVRGVRLTRGSGGWLHAVVSIHKTRRGEGVNAGFAVLTGHPSVKHVVVVDDDIDIDDPLMIEWAIATRVRGGEDIHIIRNARGSTLDPRGRDGVGDKVVVDATKPLEEPWDKYRMAGIP